MLEQRSDTFKNTAAHSQAKVLQLEQEKVRGVAIIGAWSLGSTLVCRLHLPLTWLKQLPG